MLFYKTTDRKFIDTVYELIAVENARREKTLEDLAALGARPVLLSMKATTSKAATSGPSMIGIPAPNDPALDTLPGWRRVSDDRVPEDYLVPLDGPGGDEARRFLQEHKPTDIRGALLAKYGVPRYVLSGSERRPTGLWTVGYVCSPGAVWVCVGAAPFRSEDRLPQRLFIEVAESEGEAAAARYGWGWPVAHRYDGGGQRG